MSEEIYKIEEEPVYETQIRAWQNIDPVNAENVMNPVIETIINNTHAVKLDGQRHDQNAAKHITSTERANWNDANTKKHEHNNKVVLDKVAESHLTKLSGIEEGANKYSHPNSGVTAGIYRSVTINNTGHITAGTNPTTISGYGLTDVYSKSEVDTRMGNKADTSAVNTHTSNATIHLTSAERINWNDANSKKHEHSNKMVLDGITSAKLTNWDNASTNSHSHSNKAVLDSVTQTKVNNWDGYAQKITDLNKSLLSQIPVFTRAYVTSSYLPDFNTTWRTFDLTGFEDDGGRHFDLSEVGVYYPTSGPGGAPITYSIKTLKNISGKELWVCCSGSIYFQGGANRYGVGIGFCTAGGSILNVENSINYTYTNNSGSSGTVCTTPNQFYYRKLPVNACIYLSGYASPSSSLNAANRRMSGLTVISKIVT